MNRFYRIQYSFDINRLEEVKLDALSNEQIAAPAPAPQRQREDRDDRRTETATGAPATSPFIRRRTVVPSDQVQRFGPSREIESYNALIDLQAVVAIVVKTKHINHTQQIPTLGVVFAGTTFSFMGAPERIQREIEQQWSAWHSNSAEPWRRDTEDGLF